MVKLSNAEINEIFERSARPGISGQGISVRGGIGVPTIGTSNTNLEPNVYNVSRDSSQTMKNQARKKTLARDHKINGAMSGAGTKEFFEGVKEGFTKTIQTIGSPLLDVAGEIIPGAKIPRKAIKGVTGFGQTVEKPSLKKELGITGGAKPVWSEFVKAVKDTGNLKFSDALRVASAMKKQGLYKMSDINQQNIATVGQQVL